MANNIIQKFGTLVSKEPSQWHRDAKFRSDNRGWLKNSQAVAIRINKALKDKQISQKQLAEQMGVSPQHINKIVKGRENLTLETIWKLEQALNIVLMNLAMPAQQVSYVPRHHHTPQVGSLIEKIAMKNDFRAITSQYMEASPMAIIYRKSA